MPCSIGFHARGVLGRPITYRFWPLQCMHVFVRSRSLGTCSRMVPSTSPSQPPSSVNEGNGVSSPCPCAMFLPFYRSISNELGWPRTKGSESESKTFLLLNYVSFVSFKIIFVHFWSSCTLQSSWGVVTCIYDSLYLFFFFNAPLQSSSFCSSPSLLFILVDVVNLSSCYGT